MKNLWISLIILLLGLVNGLLLYMHYTDSNANGQIDGAEFSYFQEIEVIKRSNEFVVRHHFKDLPSNRLEIKWPVKSDQRTCHLEDGESCVRLNEETTAFTEGKEQEQSISYVIPYENQTQNVTVEKMFAELYDGAASQTMLHISDETNQQGMWLTGLPPIGKQSLDLISYFLYFGEGNVTDLYWKSVNDAMSYSANHLSIYGATLKDSEINNIEHVREILNIPYLSLLLTNDAPAYMSKQFIVTTKEQLPQDFERYIMERYDQHFTTKGEASIVKELVMSLYIDRPLGSMRTKEMLAELEEALSEDGWRRLQEEIAARHLQEVDAQTIDEILQTITGQHISYVERNQTVDKKFPFLFEHGGKMIVEEKPIEAPIVLKDNKKVYPLEELLTLSGFKIRENEHSYYIEKETERFRFPKNNDFYVHNNKRINLRKPVLERIAGQLYVEEATLVQVFKVQVEKRDTDMHVSFGSAKNVTEEVDS